MTKRVWSASLLGAALLGGCVVSTVEGAKGDPGDPGQPGDMVWSEQNGIATYENGRTIGIGTLEEHPTDPREARINLHGNSGTGPDGAAPSATMYMYDLQAETSNHEVALIQAEISSDLKTGALSFFTQKKDEQPSNNGWQLGIHIEDGHVGIGEPASPDYALAVAGDVTTGYIAAPAYFVTPGGGYFAPSTSVGSSGVGLCAGGLERVTILDNGNVGVGTVDPQAKVEIDATGLESDSKPVLWIKNLDNDAMTYAMAVGDEDSGGDLFALRMQGSGQPALDLYLSGKAYKPGGGSWQEWSDSRLKKDIQPLSGALERLLRLRGVTYQWREPEKHGNLTGTQIGMIAQEVEPVFPEWVGMDPNGYKTLGYRGFEALAVESLRELKHENDTLQRKVDDLTRKADRTAKLEADLAAERAAREKLEARLAALEARLAAPR